jgi:hypothetical protein
MQTENPFIIRKAETRDLLNVHINDTISYRTTVEGAKSITMEWLKDFHETVPTGICVAEHKETKIIVGHSMSYTFNKRWDETNFDFLRSDLKVSSYYENNGISSYGKSIVVLPEYRKYHLAYSLFKWMVVSKKHENPNLKYVLGLCEGDRKTKKLHYVIGYRPKYVFNKMFYYNDGSIVDGILLETSIEHLYNGFTTGSFKKWFGVTGDEAHCEF